MKKQAWTIESSLRAFLLRKRMLTKFKANVAVDRKIWYGRNHLKRDTYKDIGEAFVWHNTPEGHICWDTLHSQYCQEEARKKWETNNV